MLVSVTVRGWWGRALHPPWACALGRPGLGEPRREEETRGTGRGGQGTRGAGDPRCRALVPGGLRISRPLAGNRPSAEGPDIPGTGMTKPLEVLEGEGEGRASAAPEHPRDPRGGLLLLRHTWTGLVLVTPFLQYSEPKYRHMLLYRRRPEVPWRDFLCLGS